MNVSNEEVQLLVSDAYKTLQKIFAFRWEYRKDLRGSSYYYNTRDLDRQFKGVRESLEHRVGKVYSVHYTPGPADIVDLEALGRRLECIRTMYWRIINE